MGVNASKLRRIIGAKGYNRLTGTTSPTPRGYIPVCVGVNNETKRYVIHRAAFGDADFLDFLYKSAEEYDFCNEGILRIPYEAKEFEEWLIRRAKWKMLRVKPT